VSNPYALTDSERQVVDMLMAGMTGREVSTSLGVDRRTVALLRLSARHKCGARNWLHLAHLVATMRPAQGTDAYFVLDDYQSAFAQTAG